MKKTITSQGFLFLKENPLYLIYPFLSAIGNLAAFYLFIYISESIYGVKVFSTATLESWFSLQFWNKINHIVIAVLLIYIFYTILIFFSAIAAREISFNLDGKPKNILNSLSLTIKRFFAIIKYSAIESINTLIGFVKLLEIKNHLISLKRKILNEPNNFKNKEKLETNKFLLVLPNILNNNKNLKYNIDLSKKQLEEALGKNQKFSPNYKNTNFILVGATIIIFIVTQYIFNILSALLISITIFFIVNHIVKFPLFIFIAALYNYVSGKPTGAIYTEEFIKNQFEEEALK